MKTVQQCIIRVGFQLPSDFYYRNKNGEVISESLPVTGDENDFLSLDAATVSREELMLYLDAVEQAADLYNDEFIFRHFTLDFAIYDSESGQKLMDFPYHRSFNTVYDMLKHWMNEEHNGEYFFHFDENIFYMYRENGNMYFTRLQSAKSLTANEITAKFQSVDALDNQIDALREMFQTPARKFLNAFWHELLRIENFCRQVTKEFGINENYWKYQRVVPINNDELILSQNSFSFFMEVQDTFALMEDVMIIGILKKGVLCSGDKIICLNSYYKKELCCTVSEIEQSPVGNITKASLDNVYQNGNNIFILILKNKRVEEFDNVSYIKK